MTLPPEMSLIATPDTFWVPPLMRRHVGAKQVLAERGAGGTGRKLSPVLWVLIPSCGDLPGHTRVLMDDSNQQPSLQKMFIILLSLLGKTAGEIGVYFTCPSTNAFPL